MNRHHSGQLSSAPFNADEGASGHLAAKTVKVLASLPNDARAALVCVICLLGLAFLPF